jgi:hypothetical protein
MGTKRKPMKKSSCKPMLPVLQRKTNSQGPTASPRNFFFLVFLLSRRCRHQPTAMNGRAQKVSMGRQRSTYQRRAYDGKAAKGAVDGHRRGWGYIVKFLHPMYFFPSLVQPPYHNTRPSTELIRTSLPSHRTLSADTLRESKLLPPFTRGSAISGRTAEISAQSHR